MIKGDLTFEKLIQVKEIIMQPTAYMGSLFFQKLLWDDSDRFNQRTYTWCWSESNAPN